MLRPKERKIEAKSVSIPFEEQEFVDKMRSLSDQEVLEHRPAITLKWMAKRRQAMQDKATKQNSGIEHLFGDFSIDAKPSTTNLE
jgi:hypothetical protein